MSEQDEDHAISLGLDERDIRLECLRLALAGNSNAPIDAADRFARFILRGEVDDA